MRLVGRLLVGLVGLVALILAVAAGYLLVAPPDLLRVATGYSAKIVCSNSFIAHRDPAQVMAVDVQAPGHPLLRFVGIAVDEPAGTVTARLLGLFATSVAVYRDGLGCTSVPDGDIAAARATALPGLPPTAPSDAPWPEGEGGADSASPAIANILADASLTGQGMRAVVVVKDGRIVGETYGPGFAADTPLLGWSMTKTVNAMLVGRLMAEGKLSMADAGLLPTWSGDGRAAIALSDLLAMTGGLAWDEEYADVSDVVRMLYLEPDMARFAGDKPAAARRGETFNYSSGTGVLLSRIWMDRVGDKQAALAFPRTALFDPLGIKSAVMEADEAGTYVGSSYLYATARDWARLGQFLLEDGVWNGTRLLPEGFVGLMATPNGLPGGYSRNQSWVLGPSESEGAPLAGLPEGTFWLDGHDGQSIGVIPAAGMVVVRLGLTPSKLGYGPEKLAMALIDATR